MLRRVGSGRSQKAGDYRMWSLKQFALGISIFIFLSTIPTVFAYPFKQDSTIELDYNDTVAPVNIQFSGEINEYQGMYYDLFFVLIGVNEGYRAVEFCTITLQIGEFNMTKTATFYVEMLPSSIHTFYVSLSTTFQVPNNTVIRYTTNGTLPFTASYKFKIQNYYKIFMDDMTGTVTIKVNGETVPENISLIGIFVVTISLTIIVLKVKIWKHNEPQRPTVTERSCPVGVRGFESNLHQI